jgi:dinuclear metal center YbgI/SA1388 family protein
MIGITKVQPLVEDIINVMERLAPSTLAESWDNCGLQAGSRFWPVRKIWVALDPLLQVIEAASHQKVDLLITHHPLMIKPITSIDVDSPLGQVIEKAITTKIAIFAAHTNLDSASEGINDMLAGLLGIQNAIPMVPAAGLKSSSNDPQTIGGLGLGRIGCIDQAMSVEKLVQNLKATLGLEKVRVAGDQKMIVSTIAVCSGGGGGLLEAFFNSEAQVYICGDLRYHDARAAEERGRVLIDIGHFPSEHIMVGSLTRRLQAEMDHWQWAVKVEPCQLEKEPFVTI